MKIVSTKCFKKPMCKNCGPQRFGTILYVNLLCVSYCMPSDSEHGDVAIVWHGPWLACCETRKKRFVPEPVAFDAKAETSFSKVWFLYLGKGIRATCIY